MGVAQLANKTMIEVYDDLMLTKPKSFLRSFFKTRPENLSSAMDVEVDVVRAGKRVAVDVIMGTGPRMNKSGRFTTKLYTPPSYDEADSVTGLEVLERLPGETPYQVRDKISKVFAKIARKQIELTNMIERAWELQASQALGDGAITLTNAINGAATIDFGLRATHKTTATTAWSNVAADIIGDIIALGKVVREDGHTKITDLIVRGTVVEYILNNTVIKGRQLFIHSDRDNFVLPKDIGSGGTFHGVLSAGDHRIRIWSYDETYDTESVSNNYYVSDEKAILLSEGARFDAKFAGVPVLVPAENDPVAKAMNLPAIPTTMAKELVPYYVLDWKKRALIAGIASRPLLVPTAIDTYGTIDLTP
jgi:hypothetical protein